MKILRTQNPSCTSHFHEIHILTERYLQAESEIIELRKVNRRLYDAHNKAVELLKEVATAPKPGYERALVNENRLLRQENQHLRDILLLADYDFATELVQESIKNCASEASSFLLTTPPRSPVHNHRNNTRKPHSASGTAVSSPARSSVSTAVSTRNQPPSIAIEDFVPDVADVGPPMSPPPNAPPRKINPPQLPIRDPNDIQDAQEAQEGAEEVDHDLSI